MSPFLAKALEKALPNKFVNVRSDFFDKKITTNGPLRYLNFDRPAAVTLSSTRSETSAQGYVSLIPPHLKVNIGHPIRFQEECWMRDSVFSNSLRFSPAFITILLFTPYKTSKSLGMLTVPAIPRGIRIIKKQMQSLFLIRKSFSSIP